MEIILKNVRLSYPNLFHAQEFKTGDGKPRWSASFIVTPGSENDQNIQRAIELEAKNLWAAKAPGLLKSMLGQSSKYCYSNGNSKGQDEYQGMMVLSTHRSAKLPRPLVVDSNKSPLTHEDAKPYAGCYVNAKVEIYCQSGDNQGVRGSFSVIQFAGDGDAFGASAPSADEFDDLSAGAQADDLF